MVNKAHAMKLALGMLVDWVPLFISDCSTVLAFSPGITALYLGQTNDSYVSLLTPKGRVVFVRSRDVCLS